MLTLAQFKARVDEQTLIELTDPSATAVDDGMCQAALDDTWQEIQGYLFLVAGNSKPSDAMLVPHHFDLAMYRLAGNRSGDEFDSFVARYKASIRYLESLKSGSTRGEQGVSAEASEVVPLMDAGSLAAFGESGVPQ